MERIYQPGIGDVVQFKAFARYSVIVGLGEQVVHAAQILCSDSSDTDVLSLPGTHFRHEISAVHDRWPIERIANGMLNHIKGALSDEAVIDIHTKMMEELAAQQGYEQHSM